MKLTVKIEGMSCGHCSARVEKALNRLPGVRASVNLADKTATVESISTVEGDALDEGAIRAAITEAGYTPVQ